jgi:hypothetical protein
MIVLPGLAAPTYHASAPTTLAKTQVDFGKFSVAWLTKAQATPEVNITFEQPLPSLSTMELRGTIQQADYTCVSVQAGGGDEWCATVCKGVDEPVNKDMLKLWRRGRHGWKTTNPECSPQYCTCYPSSYTHEDMIKAVQAEEKKQPSGLPECMWQAPMGCSVSAPYECLDGSSAGQCSEENFFGKPASECSSTCMHAKLLEHIPDEQWYPGPLAATDEAEEVPHYEHNPDFLTMEKRGIEVRKLNVRMNDVCKRSGLKFVGVSLYSPSYVNKATRLLQSCERNNVCCKATEMPTNVGPDDAQVKEGSNEYRWQLIAMKPAFILNQLEANQLPVVFLDTDLEFHKHPDLFMPGSWPDGPRDVAIFNFWGNQSSDADSPASLGSGLAFFNKTKRAKRLATAWAEAMAFDANQQAPDDQVLNKLVNSPGGGWMPRASFGWLPASYLRHPPLFYYGVDPVIDHDHGNPPGLIEHSSSEPVLPPEISADAAATGGGPPVMKCEAVSPATTPEWCQGTCTPERCPEELCKCEQETRAKCASC